MRKPSLPAKVVFFCGHESPYGFAHLAPILQEQRFRVMAVVIATEARWDHFRQALTGSPRPRASAWSRRLKRLARNVSYRYVASAVRDRIAALHPGPSSTERLLGLCKVPVWPEFDVNAPAFLERLRTSEPDLLVCAAYPQIFQRPLLEAAKHGAVNFHPSLLPRCRGAHPIFWAIASGETESAVSCHYMTERVDEGDVICQIPFPIGPDETYSCVYGKALSLVPDLITRLGDFIEDPSARPFPQDSSRATVFRNERAIHLSLFWSKQAALEIYNLVRAAEGSASCWVAGRQLFVEACSVSPTNRNLTNGVRVPNGTIVDTRDGISIKVADGVVTVTKWSVDPEADLGLEIGQILP